MSPELQSNASAKSPETAPEQAPMVAPLSGPTPAPAPAPVVTPAPKDDHAALPYLVRLVLNNWGYLTSGTAVAVAVASFGFVRDQFETYVRSVVYPGLQSVSDDQAKRPEAVERYLATMQYLRRAVVPGSAEPFPGTRQYEKVSDIKEADQRYQQNLQRSATKLLFPDIDKPTPDETIVDWFQRSIKRSEPDRGHTSIRKILADNHSVVTDSIVGGVYSGSVQLTSSYANHVVPILVPKGHSVRLIYSIEGEPSSLLYASVVNKRLRRSAIAPIELQTERGTYEQELTQKFDDVRAQSGSSTDMLQGDFFYVELGYREGDVSKAKTDDQNALKAKPLPRSKVDLAPLNLVYAIVVDKGVQIRWKANN